MKMEVARRAIIEEWRRYPRMGINIENEIFAFYVLIKNYQPDLLQFRCSGDKWRKVHDWLLQHEQS